jgi:CRISPR-associated protein Csh1
VQEVDLPVLMLSASQENGSFMKQKIKPVKQTKTKGKELLNAWLELNCDERTISFVSFAYQFEESENDFNYLGNNEAARIQTYVVRDSESLINYWLGIKQGIFMNILNFLPESELKDKLEACRKQELFNENGLNPKYMEGIASETRVYVVQDGNKKKKIIELSGEQISAESWLLKVMGLTTKQKIMLIVPVIILNGQRTVISQNPDYINAIEAFLSNDDSGKEKKKSQEAVCHLCGQMTDTIDTKSYCSKLDRKSISKVFVTTTINYAPNFESKLHQRNFALCKSCYKKWLTSEKSVMQDYRLKIAGENSIILVEGIGKMLNREGLSKIKNQVDIAFNPKNSSNYLEELTDDYLEIQDIDLYEFNLIIYKTDGKSCSIKKSIEDISSIWFKHILEEFEKIRRTNNFIEKLKYFDLGTVYRLIPVRTNTKREQVNIERVLEFYAAILQQGVIESEVIFSYFTEAIEIGYKEIQSSELRNYHNLHNIKWYHERYQQDKQQKKGIRSLEWYIKYMCFAYLALIETLQKLDIIRNGVFYMAEIEFKEDEELLEENEDITETKDKTKKIEEIIRNKEDFLDRHGFSDYAKGIYYVGAMMYEIGVMQYHQDHIYKPILNKVNYSGMSHRNILDLLEELYAKIQQYRAAMDRKKKGYLSYYAERFGERAFTYLGDYPKKEDSLLVEKDNLFYLLS